MLFILACACERCDQSQSAIPSRLLVLCACERGHGMQVDSSVAAPIPDCAVHVHGQVVEGPGVVHVDAVAAPIGEGDGSVVVEGGEVVVDTVTHQPAPESVEEDMPVPPPPPDMSNVHEVK